MVMALSPRVILVEKEWDFWFEANGKVHFLNPQNHTMFAKAGTTVAGTAGCQ